MPQETLSLPPVYCLVGAYRLAHDPQLWRPMWLSCSKAAKQAGLVALVWGVLTWPLQRLFVHYFMSASASVTGFSALYGTLVSTDDDLPTGFRLPLPSLQTFATLMFVLGQMHTILEFWLRRKLGECRKTAYTATVRSRGKSADWWTPYTEEFKNPPTQKAIKDAKKQAWYLKLASPLVRFVILKGAALRSLSYGRLLHQPFFEAKRMSPMEIELWITERQLLYRSFGFVAALMERIPLIGLIFSVSNRIGAAMWAHDLEKRQQRFRSPQDSSSKPELEEYENRPTLKKIYKNVRDEQEEEKEGSSGFNGEGLAILRFSKGTAVFTSLAFTFPLKLITPRDSSRNASQQIHSIKGQEAKAVAALYVVGYGGGLVSGDKVEADFDVGQGCVMCCLTQGSTKVFKTRSTRPTEGVSTATYERSERSERSEPGETVGNGNRGATRQSFRFLIRPNSTLVLLPDPVTCFASAKYDQVQRFDLRDRSSSLVVLDWITPGRTAVSTPPKEGKLNHLDAHSSLAPPYSLKADYSTPPRTAELWSFSSYRSRNEIRSCGQVVARDVLLLSQDPSLPTPFSELARRNHPFGCYATLLLAGPDAATVIERLKEEFESIQQRPTTTVGEGVLWSLSEVEQGLAVVRLAGGNAEEIRGWLWKRLGGGLEDVVGRDLVRQALGS